MDLKGTTNANGSDFYYFLVAIEHGSHYMELYSLLDCVTVTVMKAFSDKVIFRFGKPMTLDVDRASYFTSDAMKSVVKLLGCELNYTFSYVHYLNRKVEAMIRMIASKPKFAMGCYHPSHACIIPFQI